jgi:hypothetical protein
MLSWQSTQQAGCPMSVPLSGLHKPQKYEGLQWSESNGRLRLTIRNDASFRFAFSIDRESPFHPGIGFEE